MVLRDHEKRILADIERQLAEESPRLARRFAEFQPIPVSALVIAGLGLLMLLATGLVITVVGVQQGSPIVIISGALITAVVPAAIGWMLHRRGTHPRGLS